MGCLYVLVGGNASNLLRFKSVQKLVNFVKKHARRQHEKLTATSCRVAAQVAISVLVVSILAVMLLMLPTITRGNITDGSRGKTCNGEIGK
jgi:hypothetical protein